MSIISQCPDCEKRIRVPRMNVRVRCPHCNSRVEIRDPENDADTKKETPVAATSGRNRAGMLNIAVPNVAPADGSNLKPKLQAMPEGDSIRTGESQQTKVEPQALDTVDFLTGMTPHDIDRPTDVDSKTGIKKPRRRTSADSFKPSLLQRFRRRRILAHNRATNSGLLFKLLLGYALAVTAGLIYLLVNRDTHQLESLPDIAPQSSAEFRHIPPEADLPAGHELKLGEVRQFGALKVRPVRVTLEPLEFVHFVDPNTTREPESPVLKLWLEFENRSQAAFAPLDMLLLTKRASRTDQDVVLSNTFLCKAADVKARKQVVLNFEHSVDSEWKLKNQNAGEKIEPQQKLVSYAASEPFGFEELIDQDEELVWRLQIRKGLSGSGQAVTTLIDVVFHPSDIAKPTVPAAS